MPGPIQSQDLAEQAKAHLPRLAVLFTSGYTETAIVHGGRLDPGITLLSKPYRREDLARKIRQVLHRRGQPAPATGQTPLRILLVEDDPEVRLLLEELMEDLGCSTVAVSSAEEALDTCDQATFDVLFTDVVLPGMSGVALAREVTARMPGVRIVFASGYGHHLPDEDGDEFAWATVLTKPYNLSTVERLLEQLAASCQAVHQGR
jgi:CheY-like chemotaxis protein